MNERLYDLAPDTVGVRVICTGCKRLSETIWTFDRFVSAGSPVCPLCGTNMQITNEIFRLPRVYTEFEDLPQSVQDAINSGKSLEEVTEDIRKLGFIVDEGFKGSEEIDTIYEDLEAKVNVVSEWSVQDVYQVAEERGYNITAKQAKEVIAELLEEDSITEEIWSTILTLIRRKV